MKNKLIIFLFIIFFSFSCSTKVSFIDLLVSYLRTMEDLVQIVEKPVRENNREEIKKAILYWRKKNYLIFEILNKLKKKSENIDNLEEIETLNYLKIKIDIINKADKLFDFVIFFAIYDENEEIKKEIRNYYNVLLFLKRKFNINEYNWN